MNRFTCALIFGALVFLASCGTSTAPDMRIVSASQEVTVSQLAPNGWFEMNQNNSDVSFENGPGTPPAGTGSVCFSTGPDGPTAPVGGKPTLSTNQFNGQLLSDVDELSYWTFISQPSLTHPWLAPAIKLQIDIDGNGTRDRTLIFEPAEQVTGPGGVLVATWQQWNAYSGRWWNTGAPLFGTFHFTLAQMATTYPNARIVQWHSNLEGAGFNFGAGQNSGGFWSNVVACVDDLDIGFDGDSKSINFELTTKDSCKNGGWRALGFRTQGDCVSTHNHE